MSENLLSLTWIDFIKKESKAEDHEEIEVPGYAYDDVTGNELDPKEVLKARLKELEYIKQMKAWKKISRKEAKRSRRGPSTTLTRHR